MNNFITLLFISTLLSSVSSSTNYKSNSDLNTDISQINNKATLSSKGIKINNKSSEDIEENKNKKLIVKDLNSFQNTSNVTVTYTEGLVQKYDLKSKKFIPLNNHDEISSKTEIQLQNNSFAILRNNDSKYINVKGPVARTETQNLFEFYSDNNKEESKSIWEKIYDVINYSSEESYGEISGVTRGGGLVQFDKNKSEFYFTTEAKVLKNNDALIFWQPAKNYNSDYQIKIRYTDFENFNDKDTIFSTKDTILIIDKKTIGKCNPCEIEIINPKYSYNSPKIEMYSDGTMEKKLSDQLDLLDSLIIDFPELKVYQFAKIQLLIKNEYFATAHFLFKDYIDVNEHNKVNYDDFLNAIHKNYSEN